MKLSSLPVLVLVLSLLMFNVVSTGISLLDSLMVHF